MPPRPVARLGVFDDDWPVRFERRQKLVRPSNGAEIAPGPGPDAFRGTSRLERAILPYLREPTLWPVLLVVLAHAIVLVAQLLVFVWRDGGIGSFMGLGVLAVLSLAAIRLEVRDRRRPGAITALATVIWVLSGLAAWAGVRIGIL